MKHQCEVCNKRIPKRYRLAHKKVCQDKGVKKRK